MDRDAGAAGPGAGGCGGPDPDSTVGAVKFSAPHRRRPPIVDEQPLTNCPRHGGARVRLGRATIFAAGTQTGRPFRRCRVQLRNAPGHRASGSADAREQKAICPGQSGCRRRSRPIRRGSTSCKSRLASAKDERARDSLQQQIDLTKAQLELDQDELEDIKGRPGPLRSRPAQQNSAPVQPSRGHPERVRDQQSPDAAATTSGQYISSWIHHQRLRSSPRGMPCAARASGCSRRWTTPSRPPPSCERATTGLQSQVDMEVSNKEAIARAGQERNRSDSPGSDSSSSSSTARAITSLHQISVDQKDLSDLDKRIQDQDDLATAYGNWVDVVKARQSAVLHDMLQSAMLILLVVFAVYLCQPPGGSFLRRAGGGAHAPAYSARSDSVRGTGPGPGRDSAHAVRRAQPTVHDPRVWPAPGSP